MFHNSNFFTANIANYTRAGKDKGEAGRLAALGFPDID